MPKCQCKNKINNSQDNIAAPELSYPYNTKPEYCNAANSQENYLKKQLMKLVEILKEKMKISLK